MRRIRRALFSTALLAAVVATPAPAQNVARQGGPLFIVGGGRQPDALVDRFIALAGGTGRARIAVVPLASSDPGDSGAGKVDQLEEHGADAFVLLTSGDDARSAETVDRLSEATGIWFTGGSQSRITDALDGTPLLAAILRRNREGMVIGGTSAGAAIMSPWMITGSQVDEDADTIGYFGDEFRRIARNTIELVPGFGLLPGAIIDQHFVRRERHNRLISVVLEHPELVGVGIDESTALEVDTDGTWHVRGASVALVVDARDAVISDPDAAVLGAASLTVHVLPPGSSYDPTTRRVTLAADPPMEDR